MGFRPKGAKYDCQPDFPRAHMQMQFPKICTPKKVVHGNVVRKSESEIFRCCSFKSLDSKPWRKKKLGKRWKNFSLCHKPIW